jgi:hypothetical protein
MNPGHSRHQAAFDALQKLYQQAYGFAEQAPLSPLAEPGEVTAEPSESGGDTGPFDVWRSQRALQSMGLTLAPGDMTTLAVAHLSLPPECGERIPSMAMQLDRASREPAMSAEQIFEKVVQMWGDSWEDRWNAADAFYEQLLPGLKRRIENAGLHWHPTTIRLLGELAETSKRSGESPGAPGDMETLDAELQAMKDAYAQRRGRS